jgi:hypothetical protein
VPPGADEDHGEHEQESEKNCDGGDAELVEAVGDPGLHSACGIDDWVGCGGAAEDPDFVPAVVGDVGTCDE